MDLKQFRLESEKDLVEKLFVVLESWYNIPEPYVLLSGCNGFYVYHYEYRGDTDSWLLNKHDFSNMKSALNFISKIFKDDYGELTKKEGING